MKHSAFVGFPIDLRMEHRQVAELAELTISCDARAKEWKDMESIVSHLTLSLHQKMQTEVFHMELDARSLGPWSDWSGGRD